MKKSLTQETIAEQIGTCRTWANLVINGHANASFNLAKKFSLLTDTSPLIWMESGHRAERKISILKVKLSTGETA